MYRLNQYKKKCNPKEVINKGCEQAIHRNVNPMSKKQ